MASDKSNSIWFELAGSTSHESFMSPTCSACSPLRFINYSKSGGNIIYSERGNLSFSDGFLISNFAVSNLQHAWENPRYMLLLLLLLTLLHGFFYVLFFMFILEGFSDIYCSLQEKLRGTLIFFFFLELFFDIYFYSFKVTAYRRNFVVHWYSCPSLLMSSTEWLSGTDGLRIDVKLFLSPCNQNCFGI